MRRLLLIALFCLLPVTGRGAITTYFAHSTVNNDADCVCQATGIGAGPCSDQKAIDCGVIAGDTVVVSFELGVAALTAVIDIDTNSGASNNYITFTTPTCDITDDTTWKVWDASVDAGPDQVNCWNINGPDYLIIKCQEFRNATGDNINDGGSNEHIRWEGCKAHNAGGRGFEVDQRNDFYLVEAYSNGTVGLFARGGLSVVGSYLHDNTGDNLKLDSNDVAVINNVLDTAGGYNLVVSFRGIVYGNSLYNATTSNMDINGVQVGIYNNIIEDWGNANFGIECDAGEQCHADYNALWDAAGADYSNVVDGGNNQTAHGATLFSNAAGADFTADDAVARDAGMPALCSGCTENSGGAPGAVQENFNAPGGGGGGENPDFMGTGR